MADESTPPEASKPAMSLLSIIVDAITFEGELAHIDMGRVVAGMKANGTFDETESYPALQQRLQALAKLAYPKVNSFRFFGVKVPVGQRDVGPSTPGVAIN